MKTVAEAGNPQEAIFGRAAALVELGRATDRSRLVTVVGPPGVGKTRLVKEWLSFHQPAAFIDLTSARDRDEIIAAIAGEVDPFIARGEQIPEEIGAAVRRRGLRVIALDGCERATPAARELVGRLMPLAPGAIFALTSRQLLGVRGEWVLPLGPLAVEEARGSPGPAVHLLVAAAIRAGADPALLAADPGAMREIARLADGLPLALELAAARLAAMSPAALVARMRDRLSILRRDASDESSRHASLESAIASSWELLGGVEQRVLAECSMFLGEFTREAAEAVATPPPDGVLIDVLRALRERSLLVSSLGAPERFGMLLSVRDYAAARLEEMTVRAAARRRYVAYWMAQMVDRNRAISYAAVGASAVTSVPVRGGELIARLYEPDAPARPLLPILPVETPRRLLLHVQGAWFRLDDGQVVACHRWKLLGRLMIALARARIATPGQPVSACVLLSAGWPMEVIQPRAARNRLNVAIHRLRRLGLEQVLLFEPGGWLLDRRVNVELRDGHCPD